MKYRDRNYSLSTSDRGVNFFEDMSWDIESIEHKGLEIGSCPIKMVDDLSNQVHFLFTNPTKTFI